MNTPAKPKRGSCAKWSKELTKEKMTHLPPNTMRELDPERYECILQLIREGVALKAIQRATGASTSTLYRLMAEDPSLNNGAGALAAKLRRHAHHALDRLNELLEESPEELSYRDIAVSMGIATDKIDRLSQSEAAPSLSLTQVNVNAVPDLNKLIAGLPGQHTSKQSGNAQVIAAEQVGGKK